MCILPLPSDQRVQRVRRFLGGAALLAWALIVPSVGPFFSATASAEAPSSAQATVGGPVLPNGDRITCDLPGELHRRNTESKGLGLCVFTSLHHAATYQNVPQLVEFPKYLIDNGIPGGGYPEKVRELVAKVSRSRSLTAPDYLQVEDADLEILKAACRSGRMPGVTYGISPTGRYSGQAIAHMVSLVHADDRYFVILDNNYIGENAYEHLSPQEFLRAYCTVPSRTGRPINNGAGWAVILLNCSPPPIPVP